MNTILEQQLADQRDAAEKKVMELEERLRVTNIKYTGMEDALLRSKQGNANLMERNTHLESRIRDLEQQIFNKDIEFGRAAKRWTSQAMGDRKRIADLEQLLEHEAGGSWFLLNLTGTVTKLLEQRISDTKLIEQANKNIVDIEQENAEYRRENDHKLSAMMRLREELADAKAENAALLKSCQDEVAGRIIDQVLAEEKIGKLEQEITQWRAASDARDQRIHDDH